MSKRFTDDETGEKYQIDVGLSDVYGTEGTWVIKPVVRAEEKQKYQLLFACYENVRKWDIDKDLEFTEPQAQAVAEAIKSLMEHITRERVDLNLVNAAVEARKALGNGGL